MGCAMNVGKTELSALTRMFSATVLREFGRSGRSALFTRLLLESGLIRHVHPGATIGDTFDRAFESLRALGNRDEYVYRSAITQKILLGHHNLRTASMLSEVRVGTCKADVVVLNGTATAYEIKSERDSLARLSSQISSYSRVFAAVNVVTSPSYVSQVSRLVPREVGVIVLSSGFTLQSARPATVDPSRIDALAVLDLIRADEAISILRALKIDVPEVPNTQLRRALSDVFSTLDPSTLHKHMVNTLKQSRSQQSSATSIQTIPMSLRAAILSLNLNHAAQLKVREATRLPVHSALAWS